MKELAQSVFDEFFSTDYETFHEEFERYREGQHAEGHRPHRLCPFEEASDRTAWHPGGFGDKEGVCNYH